MSIDYFFLSKIDLDYNFNWEKTKGPTRVQEIVQYKNFDPRTEQIINKLIDKIVDIKKLYGSRVEICQIQKTSKGGIFDWHVDFLDGRNCVSIIYLSDISDGLVGGFTEFNINDNVQKIIPKKGYCCCFDPHILHRGSEVIEGIKYSIVIVFNNKGQTEYEINSLGDKKIIYYKKSKS